MTAFILIVWAVIGYILFRCVTPNRTIALPRWRRADASVQAGAPGAAEKLTQLVRGVVPVTQIDDNVAGRPPRAPLPDEASEIRLFVTIRD